MRNKWIVNVVTAIVSACVAYKICNHGKAKIPSPHSSEPITASSAAVPTNNTMKVVVTDITLK